MSYILDALRRADAERERDPARGIHAQPVRVPVVEAAPVWRRPSVVLAAIAAVTVVVGVALWRSGSPGAPASVAVAPSPSAPAPSVATPSVAAPSVAAPSVAAQGGPVPAGVPGTSLATSPAATVANAVVPAAPPMPAPAPAPPARKAAPPASASASAAAPAASAPPERILGMNEAPPEVQRLAISGGVYSENASQRMLIVAGQVVGEGAELAPGIVLEHIRPKSAVVRVRGQRVAVPF
jgi:general secretion pathway protein B